MQTKIITIITFYEIQLFPESILWHKLLFQMLFFAMVLLIYFYIINYYQKNVFDQRYQNYNKEFLYDFMYIHIFLIKKRVSKKLGSKKTQISDILNVYLNTLMLFTHQDVSRQKKYIRSEKFKFLKHQQHCCISF